MILDCFKNSLTNNIYIYTVVITVCLFVCPIITREPFDQFASNFDWGGKRTEMFLAWFRNSKLSGFTLIEKV